jgi:hypothetical protein
MWTGYEAGVKESVNRYQATSNILNEDGSRTYYEQISHHEFMDFIIEFIRKNKEKLLFIYYPMVIMRSLFVNIIKETNPIKSVGHNGRAGSSSFND